MTQWFLTSFYLFTPLRDPKTTKAEILARWEPEGIRALVILSNEGLNGTIAAPSAESRQQFQAWMTETFGTMEFKDSESTGKSPFRKFTIKLRPEIVTLGRPDLKPTGPHRHLSATEWEKAIESGAILLDTRNLYESKIGTFKGALIPPIDRFEEFPAAVDQMNIPKDQQILIFCTGGIRCEKAILAMEERGYQNVSQLDGGILKYFEDTKGDKWDGECFVFDYRVAVKKDLTPSERYTLCPLCGDPAEHPATCVQCGTEKPLCEACAAEPAPVCSKNCRYHHELTASGKRRKKHAPPNLQARKGV
ncbi:MAG: hypothetical protein KF789_06640 [Bdellovibrionaceae bacterium]|nr:hypothetical protein [Pseudobdellovibrionaceae bacterium]